MAQDDSSSAGPPLKKVKGITVKQENCTVVLLYILMDDTPTIDVTWIFLCVFSIYVDFCVQKCRCASHV